MIRQLHDVKYQCIQRVWRATQLISLVERPRSRLKMLLIVILKTRLSLEALPVYHTELKLGFHCAKVADLHLLENRSECREIQLSSPAATA